MNNPARRTILLVEDDGLTALIETDLLRNCGYDVVVAKSGEAAVPLATNDDRIALVLMDISLGAGMDGTEAARRILERRNLPIVFLSSHTEREFVERIKGIAGYGYVVKNSGDVVLQSSIDMAFKLFDAMQTLRASEEGLEATVAERTRELKEHYDDLVKTQTAMLFMVEDLNRQAKELKDAQERIVRSEKLAVVGQLASSVAHELRNPLGVIKNAVYYLNMLKIGRDNPDIEENLNIISAEIDNSDKVIGDLLEFSRIKQPDLKPEDINLIVKDTLSRVKLAEGVEIVMELAERLPPIQADAQQLQQVFYNLAVNAVQAIGRQGILTVSSCVTGDKTVAIAFRDTGCGIPKDNMRKIFEPLFSTKAKGTGLGLTVVASLVEGHGGKLEVESELGKGSVFTVLLPVK